MAPSSTRARAPPDAMARYRKVDPRIWNDEKFRALSDDAKLTFLFLLTHPHMTAIGAMRSTVPGLAAEMGWELERYAKAFAEPLAKGMAKHDPVAAMIWLPKFIRYNAPENPNVLKAWGSALDLLPECDLTREAIQSVKAFAEGLPKAFAEALPEPFAKGFGNTGAGAGAGAEAGEPPIRPALKRANGHASCPVERLVELYHETLPANPRCRVLTDTRKRHIAARWDLWRKQGKYDTEEQGLAWWAKFFTFIGESAFLTGQAPPKAGRAPFVADIDFVFAAEKHVQIIEGKYHGAAAA